MPDKLARCTVVEVDDDAHLLSADVKGPPRDLLPWSDPYIARLLTKYRLQAALDDSLRFVSDQSRRGFVRAVPAEVDRGAWTPLDPVLASAPAGRVVLCRRRPKIDPRSSRLPWFATSS